MLKVEILDRVNVLASFVLNSAKHENLFALKGARGVIVSSSGQVREVLPLIRIDVVILTSDSGANATT